MLEVDYWRYEIHADARHQNGGNGHQRDVRSSGGQVHRKDGALIPAEEILDALEGDGICFA